MQLAVGLPVVKQDMPSELVVVVHGALSFRREKKCISDQRAELDLTSEELQLTSEQ